MNRKWANKGIVSSAGRVGGQMSMTFRDSPPSPPDSTLVTLTDIYAASVANRHKAIRPSIQPEPLGVRFLLSIWKKCFATNCRRGIYRNSAVSVAGRLLSHGGLFLRVKRPPPRPSLQAILCCCLIQQTIKISSHVVRSFRPSRLATNRVNLMNT